MATTNVREAGGTPDAGEEGTEEEGVDGEAEETAKHDCGWWTRCTSHDTN